MRSLWKCIFCHPLSFKISKHLRGVRHCSMYVIADMARSACVHVMLTVDPLIAVTPQIHLCCLQEVLLDNVVLSDVYAEVSGAPHPH